MKFKAVIEEQRGNNPLQKWYYWVGAVDGPCSSGLAPSKSDAEESVKHGAYSIKYPTIGPYRREWEFEL